MKRSSASRARRRVPRSRAGVAVGWRLVLIVMWVLLSPCCSEGALPAAMEDLPIPNITPTGEIFSLYIGRVPAMDPETYALTVDGEVGNPRTYTLDDLKALPAAEEMAALRCLGHRPQFGWQANAVWKGVRLADVLNAAGPSAEAEGVVCYGADGFVTGLSMGRALLPQTLLAYEVNGEILPATLGFPVRVIAPGTHGLRQAMWVTRIQVWGAGFQEHLTNVLHKPPSETIPVSSEIGAPPAGSVFTVGQPAQVFGSVVADGALEAGGFMGVDRVEVSVDGKATWLPARIYRNPSPFARQLWGFEWTPERVGMVEVAVRAFDVLGNGQPLVDTDYNDGYNAILSDSFQVDPKSADLNQDGRVDETDLRLFLGSWHAIRE